MNSHSLFCGAVAVAWAVGTLLLASDVPAATFTNQAAAVLGSANVDGRSASLADIDKDGDLDLFFQVATGSHKLYRNNLVGLGTLTFSDISSMLPGGLGASWSAAWGDYDGDGRIDVFVGQSNTSVSAAGDLLKNNWPAAFTNVSVATGLDDPGFHQNVAWNDIDNDRDLDLLIGMEGPEKHEIYLQGPAGSFTPVGAAVGFQAPVGTKGYGMAIGDTDDDGDLDVYISTCQFGGNIRNNFYENRLVETGSLGFVDIADTNGTQNLANSYGAEFHDFDDDGDLDLFMVGADQQPSKIFRNNVGNQFTDVDTITGHPLLTSTGSDLGGGRAVDYDNDGDLDLFFHDHLVNPANQARKLYRNDGGWEFTDVTAAEGIAAANEGAYDSTWGDLDRDGDQDLIAVTGSSVAERVFISNASTNGNHWLYVRLDGPSDNTTGIGASLYATLDEGTLQERTLRREANTNAGTFNQSDLPVHFGLGAAAAVDQLLIRWPDGSKQGLVDVAANQYITVAYNPGDYNGDGVIDAADYVVLRKGLGTIYTQADYDVWHSRFGQTAGSGGGERRSVPEPASAWLILTTTMMFIRLVRKQRMR
jgi:hypothetical protein